MDKKWYIIRVMSGRESAVKKYIDNKIRFDTSFRLSFGEILLPSESIIDITAKNKVRQMYPGYIFIQMNLDEYVLNAIKKVPGSFGIMCTKGVPNEISESEIDKIKSLLEGGRAKEKKVLFNKGESVSIKSGTFAGFNGVVYKVKDKRVVILVTIFGRPTPVEVDCNQVVVT